MNFQLYKLNDQGYRITWSCLQLTHLSGNAERLNSCRGCVWALTAEIRMLKSKSRAESVDKFDLNNNSVNHTLFIEISGVAAGFDRHGMPPPASNPNLWPFDLEIDMRVASKVGNLPSKFGHARLLGSRIIRYVRDGRTDGWTDGQKQRLFPSSLRSGHNKFVI